MEQSVLLARLFFFLFVACFVFFGWSTTDKNRRKPAVFALLTPLAQMMYSFMHIHFDTSCMYTEVTWVVVTSNVQYECLVMIPLVALWWFYSNTLKANLWFSILPVLQLL